MRPLWNRAYRIERLLTGQLSSRAQQNMSKDPYWASQIIDQQRVYKLIRLSGRRALKRELKEIREIIWESPSYKTWQKEVSMYFEPKQPTDAKFK